jgi:hypothetical protein
MKKVRLLITATATVPAAVAATMAVAPIPATAMTIRPDAVTQQACSPVANFNWVHLDTTHHGSQCFGGAGSTHPDYFVERFCPGNNSISVHWRSPGGSYYKGHYGPGFGWVSFGSPDNYISYLKIIKWQGNAACGTY